MLRRHGYSITSHDVHRAAGRSRIQHAEYLERVNVTSPALLRDVVFRACHVTWGQPVYAMQKCSGLRPWSCIVATGSDEACGDQAEGVSGDQRNGVGGEELTMGGR